MEGINATIPCYSNDSFLGRNSMNFQDVYLIAADAVSYCAHIICELGPLSGYEAAQILIKELCKFFCFLQIN